MLRGLAWLFVRAPYGLWCLLRFLWCVVGPWHRWRRTAETRVLHVDWLEIHPATKTCTRCGYACRPPPAYPG